jgi:hypothetical protein
MKSSTAIRKQIDEGPQGGTRVVVLASYGGPGLLLCRLGRHDSFMVSRDANDDTAVYWETCLRCGRVLSTVRFEGS